MSCGFFRNDDDYSEHTRNVDLMFEQFSKDRNKIVCLLKDNPQRLVSTLWNYNSPLSKDEDCLFNMGKSLTLSIDDMLSQNSSQCSQHSHISQNSNSMLNFYVCPQCKNMKRLIDFNDYKKHEVFMIEFGQKTGESLYYEEKNVSFLYMTKEKEPNSVKKAYQNPFISDLAKCSSATCAIPTKASGLAMLRKYSDMEYLGSDPFTNNILINWYLNREVENSHLIDMYISFICGDKGYNIYEYLDMGSIDNFQEHHEFLSTCGNPSPTAKADDKSPILPNIVSSIIVQLFSCLHSLRKFDFSHGNPSTKSLKFKKEIVSYNYDGVNVCSPVKLKLTDFTTSGCTVLNKDGLRLYSKSVVADEELKKKTYEPIIDTVVLNNSSVVLNNASVVLDNSQEDKVTVYKLKNPCKCLKSSILFMYMKHLGLPVYAASFDAYAFMTVLMSERSFYTTVMNDSKLKSFWRSMWVNSEDFEEINYRLTDFHEKSKEAETTDVLQLLSELSLRCDMIEFGWRSFSS